MTTTAWVGTLLAFLATYLVHSTVLLGGAWVLGRLVARGEAWRETLWKAALVGGLATALVAQVAPSTPLRLALPLELPGMGLANEMAPSSVDRVSGAVVADEQATSAADRVSGTEVPAGGLPEPVRFDAGVAPSPGAGGSGAGPASPAPAFRRGGPDTRRVTEPARELGGSAPRPPSRPLAWPLAFLLAWGAVALWLVARLAWRHVQLSRALRERRVVTEGGLQETLAELRRQAGVWEPVRLTASPAISSPMLLGRGDVCVPERFVTGLGPEEQRAALAHELAHLARRDRAWLLGAMVLECVFFFQPLHRVARRGLRESAEYLADSWAVRLAGGRLSLARCLAEVAGWVAPGEPSPASTVAMAEGGSPLLARVSRLLEREPEEEPRAAARALAGTVLIALAAGFAPAVVGGVGAAPSPGQDRVSGGGPTGSEGADRPAGEPERGAAAADAPPSAAERELAEQDLSVIRVAIDGDLTARLERARQQAAAGSSRAYWVAWAVPSVLPATTHVSMDSGRGLTIQVTDEPDPMLRTMSGGVPATDLLGVAGELSYAGDGYDVLLFALMDPGLPGPAIDRLAVRSPAMPLRLSGPVYWLGKVDARESLAWHEQAYRSGSDRRLGEQAIKAAALHDAPGTTPFLRSVAGAAGAGRDLRESALEGLAWHPSPESVEFLADVARNDAEVQIRAEAVETLGEIDGEGASQALQEFIREGDPRVREEALESLAERTQDATVLQTLLDVALNDRDPDMRNAAVEALGEMPASQAVPALRRLLGESRDREVLMEVAEQLGEVGSQEALQALDALLARDVDQDVAGEAVEAIAEGFPAEVARPRLEALSRDHPSPSVRRQAAEELMDLWTQGAGGGEALLDMALSDPDPELRRDAVERMAELPAAEAVPLLRRVLLEAGDREAQMEAAEALGEVGTNDALALLDDLVARNPSEELSMEALEAIADNFSRDLALPRLRQVIADHPSTRVRREALDLLADLGGVE